jgi:hypothetical protein
LVHPDAFAVAVDVPSLVHDSVAGVKEIKIQANAELEVLAKNERWYVPQVANLLWLCRWAWREKPHFLATNVRGTVMQILE